MKKLSLILVILSLLLSTGCSDTKQTSVTFKSPEYISDYERAEFEKFNSPAEVNGLGGTLIYVDGMFETIFELENCFYGRLKSGENKWCIFLSTVQETKLSQLSFLENKSIRIFGVYQGFAQNLDMPMISCQKLTISDTGESYSILEFMSSISPVFDGAKSASIESGEELNPKSKKVKDGEFDITGEEFIKEFTLATGIEMVEFINTPVDDFSRVVFKEKTAVHNFQLAYHERLSSQNLTNIDLTFKSDLDSSIFTKTIPIIDKKSDVIVAEEIFTDLYSSLNDGSGSKVGTTSRNGITYLLSVLDDNIVFSIFK